MLVPSPTAKTRVVVPDLHARAGRGGGLCGTVEAGLGEHLADDHNRGRGTVRPLQVHQRKVLRSHVAAYPRGA